MASQDILKKIFEHQLLLTQEIRESLGDHLTEELQTIFQESETFLQKLQEQDQIQHTDLEKLQKKWEALTQAIDRMQKGLHTEIDALQTQERINQFYNR